MPSKFGDKLWNKTKKDSLFKNSSKDISTSVVDESSDVDTNSQDSHTKNEVKNESKHNDSSSKDNKDYSTSDNKKTKIKQKLFALKSGMLLS